MKKVISTPKKIEKVVEVTVESVDEIVDGDGGPVTLLGKTVFVMCSSYAYTGTLSGVNDRFIELTGAHLVYETGPWSNKAWKDAQKLPTTKLVVFQAQIESMFEVVR